MVKYTDMHRVIVSKLKTKFPTIEVTSEDVSEGFKRPSFFMSFENIKSSDFMNEALDRDITIRIYYFSKDKDKNKIELLNMQDDLSDLFLKDNTIVIDTVTSVEVHELELKVIDKVLHCYCNIMLSENYDITAEELNAPNMEDLHVKNI